MTYDTPLTFLRDPDVPGVALLAVAVNKYGTDCFAWDPMVLRKELEEDYNVKLSDLQHSKLQAVLTILTTDHFESNWHVFAICTNILNGELVDWNTFELVEAEQIAGVMPEVELLRNDDDDGIVFSPEVNAFAGVVFASYGCGKAPDVFPTAILPRDTIPSDMTEKNGALSEMYQAKKAYLTDYMSRVAAVFKFD